MAGSSSTTATEVASGKVVAYIGTADVRDIDAASWKSLQIDQKKVVWDASNKWMVPVSDLNEDAVKFLESGVASDFVVKDAPTDKD